MDERSQRTRVPAGRRLLSVAPVVVLIALPALVGAHWGQLGWRDKHYDYPIHPPTCEGALR